MKKRSVGLSRGAIANEALKAFGDGLETDEITSRDDEYGQGWNAAIRHIAARLRGRRRTDGFARMEFTGERR